MNDSSSQNRDSPRSLDLRLPPLPRTLPQVLRLLHEPGFVDVGEMAEVAQRDPAVETGLLEHVNSAHYGLRRSIENVERAVRMMGSTSAAGTVIELSMLRLQEVMKGPAGPCFTRLIRHSEAVGLLTRYLLERLPSRGRGASGRRASREDEGGAESDGFMEGLLHDFGKMVLIYNYPEKAVSLYEEKQFEDYLSDADERGLEQLVFGHDHAEAGAYAAAEMSFPTTLVEIVRQHHDPGDVSLRAENARRYDAVRAANLATKAMGPSCNGVSPADESMTWSECMDQSVWSRWIGESEREDDSPPAVVEALREKEKDMILYTEFFLSGPDTWIEVDEVS